MTMLRLSRADAVIAQGTLCAIARIDPHVVELRPLGGEGAPISLSHLELIGQFNSGNFEVEYDYFSSRQAARRAMAGRGLQVPSPATMKFVGTAVLQAAGYPLSRDKSASTIWDMVRQQLMFRQTLFLHLDEAQDLTRFQTENERRSVVNTLKSLMENSRWPVGLILSGMPEFKTIINQDPQLARRLYPVEIDRLNEFRNVGGVINLVQRYAGRAGIGVNEDLSGENFAQRLIHAADYEFGLMAELVVQAITMALSRDGLDARLSLSHFADVFHMRSAAVDGLNPFIAEDFRRIDPRQVLDHDSVHSTDDPRGPR